MSVPGTRAGVAAVDLERRREAGRAGDAGLPALLLVRTVDGKVGGSVGGPVEAGADEDADEDVDRGVGRRRGVGAFFDWL